MVQIMINLFKKIIENIHSNHLILSQKRVCNLRTKTWAAKALSINERGVNNGLYEIQRTGNRELRPKHHFCQTNFTETTTFFIVKSHRRAKRVGMANIMIP